MSAVPYGAPWQTFHLRTSDLLVVDQLLDHRVLASVPESNGPKSCVDGVEEQQFSGQNFAAFGQDLDGLDGLKNPDHGRNGAENSTVGTVGHHLRWGRCWIQTSDNKRH